MLLSNTDTNAMSGAPVVACGAIVAEAGLLVVARLARALVGGLSATRDGGAGFELRRAGDTDHRTQGAEFAQLTQLARENIGRVAPHRARGTGCRALSRLIFAVGAIEANGGTSIGIVRARQARLAGTDV